MVKKISLALTLTTIAALSGLFVGYMHSKTVDIIEKSNTEKFDKTLKSLFEDGIAISKDSVEYKGNKKFYYIAKSSDSTIGYAIKTGSYGYSSTIKFIVAVKPNSKIIGLSVLSQEETPGLGTRTEESISDAKFYNGLLAKLTGKLTYRKPWFQAQFSGLDLSREILFDKSREWHKLNDKDKEWFINNNSITAITGATISTKAVRDGVNNLSELISVINKKNNIEVNDE